jgi:hypothetical protein
MSRAQHLIMIRASGMRIAHDGRSERMMRRNIATAFSRKMQRTTAKS